MRTPVGVQPFSGEFRFYPLPVVCLVDSTGLIGPRNRKQIRIIAVISHTMEFGKLKQKVSAAVFTAHQKTLPIIPGMQPIITASIAIILVYAALASSLIYTSSRLQTLQRKIKSKLRKNLVIVVVTILIGVILLFTLVPMLMIGSASV